MKLFLPGGQLRSWTRAADECRSTVSTLQHPDLPSCGLLPPARVAGSSSSSLPSLRKAEVSQVTVDLRLIVVLVIATNACSHFHVYVLLLMVISGRNAISGQAPYVINIDTGRCVTRHSCRNAGDLHVTYTLSNPCLLLGL